MKIEIIIHADHGKEAYLHENSDRLKDELLCVIEKFVGKDAYVDYAQEDAQIDVMTGDIINHNPYPIQRQFDCKYDKEHMSLQREVPVLVL